LKNVVTTATAAPISPTSTPRRAVAGVLSHFSDRMKKAMAMMYAKSVRYCTVARSSAVMFMASYARSA
jgi:hypothetical protein